MKYIKVLAILFVITLLSACNRNSNATTIIDEITGELLEIITSNEIIEELENLESIPHLMRPQENFFSQVLLIDLITGESMAIYEFGEFEVEEI